MTIPILTPGCKFTDKDLAYAKNVADKRAQEIKARFGKFFTKYVDPTLYSYVDDAAVGLNGNCAKYPSCIVKPSKIAENVVRGEQQDTQRPYILVKVDVTDVRSKETVTVVEMIMKRYGLRGDGGRGKYHEHNYVTVDTVTEAGEKMTSHLYASGGMSEDDMEALRDLLAGKKINSRRQPGYTVRLHQKSQDTSKQHADPVSKYLAGFHNEKV